MRHRFSLALLSLSLLGVGAERSAHAQYRVIDLGPGLAYGVNASGQVVGYQDVTVSGTMYQHAFFYDGTVHDLSGLFGGSASDSLLRSINSSGQATGFSGSTTAYADARGILYSANTSSYIGSLSGANGFSRGYGINDQGQITGTSDPQNAATGHKEAFIRDANGTFHDIGSLGGDARGASINASGNVAGRSSDGTNQHSFYYDGTMHDLTPTAGFDLAFSLNNSNTVVGYYVNGGGNPFYKAYSYDAATQTLTELGYLNGTSDVPNTISTETDAYSINNSGLIVGDAYSADQNKHSGPNYSEAVLWDSTGIHDLNNMISSNPANIHLDQAFSISANGYIVGEGEVNRVLGPYGFYTPFSGVNHAFLLVPQDVPEPGMVAMLMSLLTGGAGVAARRRARRKKQSQ